MQDSDNHVIIDNGIEKLDKGNIVIGKNVWICSYVDILKNSKISNNSVVGYRALVNKSFQKENILIGGSPAKVLKDNISWHK